MFFRITKLAVLLAALVCALMTGGIAFAAQQTTPLQGSHTLTEDLAIALDITSGGDAAAIETWTGESIIGSPGVAVSVEIPDAGKYTFLYGISADGGVVSIDKFYYKGGSGAISQTDHTGILAGNGANISIGDYAEIYANGNGAALIAHSEGSVITIGDNATLYGTKSSNGSATVVAIEPANSTLGAGRIVIGDNAYIINDGYKNADSNYHIAVLAASYQDTAHIKIGNDAKIFAQGNGSNNFAISAGDANYGTMGVVEVGERSEIATSGDYSYALVSMSLGSDIILGKEASVTTYGYGSHGALAKAGGSIHIGGGSSVYTTSDIATGLFAVGCSSSEFFWPNEDLFGTSVISTGEDVLIETQGKNGYGVVSDSRDGYGAEITLGTGNKVITHGEKAYGLYSAGGEALITAEDSLYILTTGEGAHGIRAYNGGSVETGKTEIETQAKAAHGVFVSEAGDVYIGANSTIITKEDSSYGVHVRQGGSVHVDEATQIITDGTSSYGVYVQNGGKVTMDGATVLVDSGKTSYAIVAFNTSSSTMGSTIDGDGVFNIKGNISAQSKSGHAAIVDLTMQDNSMFIGAAYLFDDDSEISLSINGANSLWQLTGNSQLTNLHMDGATVDFRPSSEFTTLTVERLNPAGSGTGGSFIMRADIPGETSDQIIVTDSDSSGFYDIKVLNVGSAAASGNEIVTLATTAFGSNVTFGLANIVECGAWQYDMHYVQGLPAALSVGGIDDEWQLRGTSRASTPGTGAINSFAGSYLMAYADTQTLIQRMGDLRESPYGQGLWFRVHGGKFESNSKSYVRGFDMDYGGVQIGYDRKLENKWGGDLYTGIMFGYSKGDLDYHRNGSGEVDSKTLGIYGTYIGRSGFYVDTILKYQWMTNDFDVIDSAGILVRGQEVDTGGIGASVEFGQRLHVGKGKESGIGWYVEPQVQLSYQRQDGGYFNATNGLRIGVDSFNSLLGRVGMLVGYETNRTNLYAKVSKVKEFDGDLTVRANGVPISESFEDDWWVYGIGCTSRINDRNSLYLDIERTSGGSFSQPWRIFAGWRVEF